MKYFFKKVWKLFKIVFLSFVALLLCIGGIYLVSPSLIEDTAIDVLYPTVTIEDEYMNTYSIEIPKMNELMYIACSLTKTFQEDANLISKRVPEYSKEVSAHFSSLKNHPLVNALESKLQGNAYSQIQPTIRFFSLNYQVNADNSIVEKEIFHVNPILITLFKSKVFYYPDYIGLIEDFAKQSDFSKFYDDHTGYYQSLIQKFDQLCDIQGSWDFLENRFTERYHSYRIIFSPLTGGFHNTLPQLKDPKTQLQQTWLFVGAPPNSNIDTLSERELEIKKSQFTRELFTEMDHNYVNPLTDQFKEAVEEAIPDYTFWNKRKRGYASTISTFNEYMTWSIFTLYAKDTFKKEHIDTILTIHEDFMIKRKKFIHFKEFTEKLETASLKQQIDSLHFQKVYPEVLDWMKAYSK